VVVHDARGQFRASSIDAEKGGEGFPAIAGERQPSWSVTGEQDEPMEEKTSPPGDFRGGELEPIPNVAATGPPGGPERVAGLTPSL
jgi:hypothetical protein